MDCGIGYIGPGTIEKKACMGGVNLKVDNLVYKFVNFGISIVHGLVSSLIYLVFFLPNLIPIPEQFKVFNGDALVLPLLQFHLPWLGRGGTLHKAFWWSYGSHYCSHCKYVKSLNML